jgi:hypothetical protein
LKVQLQPADGHQGVVAAGMPLKQLALRNCTLLGRVQELVAALELLPGLEYLQFAWNMPQVGWMATLGDAASQRAHCS